MRVKGSNKKMSRKQVGLKKYHMAGRTKRSKHAYLSHRYKKSNDAKVVLSSVFGSREQEEMFFECAAEAMSTEARLRW